MRHKFTFIIVHKFISFESDSLKHLNNYLTIILQLSYNYLTRKIKKSTDDIAGEIAKHTEMHL